MTAGGRVACANTTDQTKGRRKTQAGAGRETTNMERAEQIGLEMRGEAGNQKAKPIASHSHGSNYGASGVLSVQVPPSPPAGRGRMSPLRDG